MEDSIDDLTSQVSELIDARKAVKVPWQTTNTSQIQDLPPELFNKIHELAFQATFDAVVIDANYKPLSCLQVSQASRK